MKMPDKKIIKPVVIFAAIMGCFLVHDLFTEPTSDKLFFPFLFENDCFRQIFEKDITNEKIISFECSTQWWWGNESYYEIAFFCDEPCFLSLFGSEYQVLKPSQIGQIKDQYPASTISYTFHKQLEKHHGRKKVNQVVIYYFLHHEDSSGGGIWYEPDSQLCLYFTYQV